MDILIVEDESQLRKVLQKYFQFHGWEVTTAETGEEALRILDRQPFDVVVTDIRMAEISGIVVLRTVRKKHPLTQVILMTGYRDLRSAIDAVNQGAFAYVEKPFDLKNLHETALEALEEKYKIQEAEKEKIDLASLVDRKEEELSLLKERSRVILGVIPSILVLVNLDVCIQDVNDPFLKAFRGTRENTVGRPLCDGLRCFHSENGPCKEPCELYNRLKISIKSGMASDRFTVTPPFGTSPHSDRPNFQMRILPLPSLPPEPSSNREFLIIMDDVTRERTMEMQVLHSSRLASLGEMATGIAHELSQPLNVISTQSQLLQFKMNRDANCPEETLSSALQEILDEVFRMSEILHHLRMYGRRQAAATYSEFSPGELLEGSLKLIRSQLRAWAISLEVEDQEDSVHLGGKFHELQHALTNILLNARDALIEMDRHHDDQIAQDGGYNKKIHIRIGSSLKDGVPWVSMEVNDNGIGMPPAVIERVFDPLFSTKELGEGSGLGLPIAAAILKEHKGSIRIKSEPLKGTRVILELPGLPQE
jgi:signal transduction histidine kinase/ActR/RegA family two-component response regulator